MVRLSLLDFPLNACAIVFFWNPAVDDISQLIAGHLYQRHVDHPSCLQELVR